MKKGMIFQKSMNQRVPSRKAQFFRFRLDYKNILKYLIKYSGWSNFYRG